MEHDINLLIRNKVRQAEGQPATWNKDRVWEMVNIEAEPTSSFKFIYYAAALVAIITLAFVVYQIDSAHQQELEFKIASLESEINKKSMPANQVEQQAIICSPDVPQTLMSSHSDKVSLHPGERNKIKNIPLIPAEIMHDPVEMVTAIIPLEKINLSIPEEIIQPDRQVRAIVGTIPVEPQEVVKVKVRGTKFRLFRLREREAIDFSGNESEFLSARLNKNPK